MATARPTLDTSMRPDRKSRDYAGPQGLAVCAPQRQLLEPTRHSRRGSFLHGFPTSGSVRSGEDDLGMRVVMVVSLPTRRSALALRAWRECGLLLRLWGRA